MPWQARPFVSQSYEGAEMLVYRVRKCGQKREGQERDISSHGSSSSAHAFYNLRQFKLVLQSLGSGSRTLCPEFRLCFMQAV